eukprot:jgi/Ulvmu1/3254/UM151_0002.1
MKAAKTSTRHSWAVCLPAARLDTRSLVAHRKPLCVKAVLADNPPSSATMKKVQLGNSDLQVSVACIGTMMMGSTNTEEESVAQLDYFRSKGGNFLDTAEIYSVPIREEYIGKSEEIIGRWLQDRGCRDEFIVATKVAGPMEGNFCAANRTAEYDSSAPPAKLDRANIMAAIEGSLRRLQTDYIDLYQLHWPSRYVPIFGMSQYRPEKARDASSFEELVEAVGDLIKAGKIRYWGLSNETAYGVTLMCETAKRLGVPLPITIQNDYSLCDRKFDLDTAEACHAYGIKLLPYGVLAGGFLSGKYLGGANPEGRHNRNKGFQSRYATPVMHAAAEKYKALAESKGLTLTQLAVAWASARWHIDSLISGQTKVEQMDEYLDACGLELDEETLEAIDKIHMEDRNPQWTD